MTNRTKGKLLKWGGILCDVACPLAAALSQFPIWVERSSYATVSGMFVILAFFSVLPFLRQIREYMKSPDVLVIWAVCTALFLVLRSIIDEMLVVCLIGLISNAAGSCLYKIGKIVGGDTQ